MASGGYHPNKASKSRQSNWQRSVSSDRDDAQSLNSLPSDIRINNWDLADLRPTNLTGDSKRRKKSKGNTEREREQSLSMDSPPRGVENRHQQQSFSRTKINPSTPSSQKISLENLRQQMMFGTDYDYQENDDGERNNERRSNQHRSRMHNASLFRAGILSDMINQNNNVDTRTKDAVPDSKEIVSRLVQIRDFMKQARSMLDSMEKMGDRRKPEDVEKVRRLIQNLQDQEQGYKGLLQNTLQIERQDDRSMGDSRLRDNNEDKDEVDDSSVDLEVQTRYSETSECSQDNSTRPRIEDKLGLGFEDEDDERLGAAGSLMLASALRAASTSNNALDQMDGANNEAVASAFPVQETEEGAKGGALVDRGKPALDQQELKRIINEKQQQLQALMGRQEELNSKRRDAEKRLMEAQARDNKARAALAAVASGKEMLQQFKMSGAFFEAVGLPAPRGEDGDEEGSLQQEEIGSSGEDVVLKSNIVGYPESDDEDNSNVRQGNAALPADLLELRREVNFLRNEFTQAKESSNDMESENQSTDQGRQQIQNKLQELQNKKSSVNKMLHELQSLHTQPLKMNRNNDASPFLDRSRNQSSSNIPARPPPPQAPVNRQPVLPLPALPNLPSANSNLPPSLQARMNEVASSAPSAVESAMATFSELAAKGGDDQTAQTMDAKSLEEIQDKLKRLKDVRSQLDQLRDLVEYYQGMKDSAGNVNSEEDPSVAIGDLASMLMPNELPQQRSRMPSSSSQNKQQSESHPNPQELIQELLQGRDQLQQLQQQQQQLQQHQQNSYSMGGGAEGEGAGASASTGANAQSSLLDLAQLLNLAGNENPDEHSDEDNASVSQSDSQWSNLGPWDDDPEIQEKVRKLKAAKEKLRHLQDLVEFVQQSPEAGNAIPQSLGDLVASVDGEAQTQATQTDKPNVTASEADTLPDSQQQPGEDGSLDNAKAELDSLRKERSRLLDLQSQLKHLHSVVNQEESEQQASEVSERREEMCVTEKAPPQPAVEQAPGATVVTFASNDELYSKMRRQRILREELRSKKKELEAIMKKDRNKRQYSRNQDNQSDTVSLNTDTFGIPASVDATMATWGGSTVDNLENITEDEDGPNDDEDDDGYPSDGIVQVEEEEEENDTDNGTYTIEADARQRKNLRKTANLGIGARPKTSRGRQTFPQPGYMGQGKKGAKATKRNAQGNQRESKLRQENYRSAEDLINESEEEVKSKKGEWFRVMETRLDTLSSSVECIVKKLDTLGGRQLSVSLSQENSSPTYVPPMQEQMLQLQNQSMMLSFSHVVQSLARQQGDMQQLQSQMQNLSLMLHDPSQEHSFQNLTGATAGGISGNAHHLNFRPNVSHNNLFPLATAPAFPSPNLHSLQSPFPQMNLNNSMSSNLLAQGPFGQSPNLPGQVGGLNNTFPNAASNLGSNLSLHNQHTNNNPASNSFAGTAGRDSSHQSSATNSQLHHLNLSHNHPLEGTATGHFASLYNNNPPSAQSQDREDQGASSHDRSNVYSVDKKTDSETWPKKYDYFSSQGVHMSTPKMENEEAERRRQPNDKNRRGPIGRENSSDLSYPPLYGSLSRLDEGARRAGGGDNTDGIAQLHLNSSYSSIQSIKEEHSRMQQEREQAKSSTANDNTLFDSLRDTIYTEVASLISQNENRPHFLLELFREIRQCDSDLLRQRTLYSVQEIVNSYLKSSSASQSSQKPAWLNTPLSTQETANSDQTPSESVLTSDDEEPLLVSRHQRGAESSDRKSRSQLPKFPFDYEQSVDNLSSMSTPSNLEDAPFFQDALGETVIEFESLKRVEKKHGAQSKLGEGAFLASEQLLRDMRSKPAKKGSRGQNSEPRSRHLESELLYGEGASNVPMDQASESSMSDMPYPRIDMKQLDLQIKQVMIETIPVVKEHMEDICSSQLLAYIKRLVLSLTAQTGSQEFARVFHRQLSSILLETLQKYEGRKMRECGEDLLVEISDVLFNELAFFRLMQDIEDPNEVQRLRATAQRKGRRSTDEREDEENDDNSSFNEDGDIEIDSTQRESLDRGAAITSHSNRGFHISDAEQEQLGRERDDELANVSIEDRNEQEEDDDTEHSYKIELAPSETKPFTRIGSDEDDDDSDEEQSMEDYSETAVSRNEAKMDSLSFGSQNQQCQSSVAVNGPPPVRPETEGAWGDGEKEKLDVDKPSSNTSSGATKLVNGSSRGQPLTSPKMNGCVTGGRDHGETEEEEDEELTVDDLPERLTVGSSSQTVNSAAPTNNST